MNGLAARRRCQCKFNPVEKTANVECSPIKCPAISERHLRPTAECPIPVIVSPDDPVLCPYVVCNYSDDAGKLHFTKKKRFTKTNNEEEANPRPFFI